MKKKLPILILVTCLICNLWTFPTAAADTQSAVMQTVQALGIMVGDGNGDMNLSGNVTRAQFTKMMVAASTYKDSISDEGAGYSVFSDVKSSYWASEYIKLAVQEGWVTGYTDGSFRPDKTVTLEEACSAVLKMLGYDSTTLAGSFPSAQLSKASALGLRDQMSASQGSALTRKDCMYMFYNLLTAQNSEGKTYAETLGYTVSNGEVDYTTVLMDSLSGPYTAESSTLSLSFTPLTIYRDGDVSSDVSVSQYDVYYYSTGLRTLWIYTDKISGKITSISPDSTAPTSVVISGITYNIGSSTATYKLSALDGEKLNQTVTLLLGMGGTVVDIVTGTAVDSMYYGVVQTCTKSANSDSNAVVQVSVDVVCTDGVSRTFSMNGTTTFSVGAVVSVRIASGETTIASLSKKTITGNVNSSGTALGTTIFADNVHIIDSTDEGEVTSIDVSRLAGCYLESSAVRYYVLDSNGKISHMILNNATGDGWTYGVLSTIRENTTESEVDGEKITQTSGTYTYIVDGNSNTVTTTNKTFGAAVGGIAIRYDTDGSIKSMRSLTSLRVTSLGTTTLTADNKTYNISDDVQVYLKNGNNTYYKTKLSAVNTSDYYLTAWYYPFSSTIGKQIRVIVAVAK